MLIFNIHFCGDYVSEQQLIGESKLPDNAVMFKEGDAVSDTFLPGFLTELPILLAMIWLTVCRYREIAPGYQLNLKFFIGILFTFVLDYLLTYVHEIIHGLCYPKEARKTIWKDKKQGLFFIHCDAIISKWRFFVVGIAPAFFLGILPFGIWYLIVPYLPIAVGVVWVFVTWYMVFGSMGDFCNLLHMVTQVPRGKKVMNYGLHSYWLR